MGKQELNKNGNRIIPDTNIWYLLGRDNILFEKVKNERICPNYVNIVELANTGNIVRKENSVRHAIQKMFCFQEYAIFSPPFVHIAQLINDYEYDIENLRPILDFTSIFAQGDRIENTKTNDFFNHVNNFNDRFKEATNFINDRAKIIRERINNKEKHRNKNSTPATRDFINFCVENSTNKRCNIKSLDLNQIELLVLTINNFFKTIEISELNMKSNDWFDLSILAYVRPEDKFWTEDKRLIQMIKEAGCENYLYKTELKITSNKN